MQGWDDGSEQTSALAAFGLSPEVPLGDEELAVWEENAEAVELFQRVITQWNYSAMGIPLGLRYEAVSLPLRIHVPRARWAGVMDDLQVMELAALAVLRSEKV